MPLSKRERLLLFFERLSQRGPASNHDEAMTLLETALSEIENQFSGIPYDPTEPGTDGRMYPPTASFRFAKLEVPGLRCYRQVAHVTFVADNGAIEIRPRIGVDLGPILFDLAGKNGKKVSDYDASEPT